MIVVVRSLCLLIALELAGSGVLILRQLLQVPPPQADLSRHDPLTIADLEQLRTSVNMSSADAWRELGEAYLAYGALPESEVCYRRAASIDPGSGRNLYGWACALDRLGQMAASSARYEQAAGSVPEPYNFSCWYRIGRNCLREEQPERAAQALRRAPEVPLPLSLRVRLLVRNGQLDEALPLLEKLEKLAPDAVKGILLRARLETALGHDSQAQQALDRVERAQDALSMNDQANFLTAIASQYGFLKVIRNCSNLPDRKLESDCFYRALANHPQRARFLHVAAHLAQVAGEPEEALRRSTEAMRAGALSPVILEQHGELLQQAGDADQAEQAWLRAAALGETVTLYARLAALSRGRNDEDSARRYEARQREAQGIAAYRENRLEDAIAALRSALDSDSSSARSWYYLGESLRAIGELPEARQAYEHCLKRSPTHGRARAALQRMTNETAK